MLTAGRSLFTGDAAAATDPMTGEGIGQALLTGVLAAEAIEEGGLDAARVASTYERRVRDALVADHRMSMLLTRALQHRKGARRGADRRRHGLDPPELRAMAVRGLSPFDPHHPAPLEARDVHRSWRLPHPKGSSAVP